MGEENLIYLRRDIRDIVTLVKEARVSLFIRDHWTSENGALPLNVRQIMYFCFIASMDLYMIIVKFV